MWLYVMTVEVKSLTNYFFMPKGGDPRGIKRDGEWPHHSVMVSSFYIAYLQIHTQGGGKGNLHRQSRYRRNVPKLYV